MYSDTISLLHNLNMNSAQFWLVGECEDIQLADNQDIVLSCIEWNK